MRLHENAWECMRMHENAWECGRKKCGKKCGMDKCKFTPNLKSLIARFMSRMVHHFLLNL